MKSDGFDFYVRVKRIALHKVIGFKIIFTFITRIKVLIIIGLWIFQVLFVLKYIPGDVVLRNLPLNRNKDQTPFEGLHQ